MHRLIRFIRASGFAVAAALFLPAINAHADYSGAPRTFLFNPAVQIPFSDTARFKKKPPYVIGFANAGLGDSWRVVMQHSLMKAASEHPDVIRQLIITNGNMDDAKQAADIQDLVSRGVDLLIVSANTQKALDPVVTRAMNFELMLGRGQHLLRGFNRSRLRGELIDNVLRNPRRDFARTGPLMAQSLVLAREPRF